jgi:hypothetical protein
LEVHVNSCEDYGSLTKLVPILDIEKDPDTLIVVLDDDMYYGPRVIEGLVRAHEEFRCPVGYSGIGYPETAIRYLGKNGFVLFQGHGKNSEILECAFGVLFPRWSLNGFPNIEPMKSDYEKCLYTTDDFIFSKFFDSRGIPKKIACYQWAGRFGDDWSSLWSHNPDSQIHSLSTEGNLENYIKAGSIFKYIMPVVFDVGANDGNSCFIFAETLVIKYTHLNPHLHLSKGLITCPKWFQTIM